MTTDEGMPTERPDRLPSPEEISAVEIAERMTSRRFWWERLRTITISVLVTLVITGFVSWAIGHKLVKDARDNATQNCHVQADGRPAGNGRALVERIILGIADDAFRQFPPQFQQAEVARVNSQLRKHHVLLGMTSKGTLQIPTDGDHGLMDLAPLLGLLPLIDCPSTIR